MSGRSLLIVDEHPLQVLPSLAAAIGTNEAMFLQQLHYWLEQNPHLRDGQFWVYNTVSEWNLQFPFWSERTIRRTVKSLKDQGLIRTTDEYNWSPTDRRLWYTIEYENLQAIGVVNVVDASNGQNDLPDLDNVDVSTGQPDQLAEIDNVADSSGRAGGQGGRLAEVDNVAVQFEQPDQLDLDNVNASVEQLDRLDLDKVDASDGQPAHLQESSTLSGSLYGTETTTEITAETTTETTATTTTATHDFPAGSCNPQPEEDVVVVLSNHGLSASVARRFAQKYPQEYLLEKIEFLEYEKTRVSNLANPAGWLRRAIEADFARPAGFQSASEIEAQRVADEQREAALLEAQRAEDRAMAKAKEAKAQAKEVAEAEKIASQLASIEPGHSTTESLLRAWHEGVQYVANTHLGSIRMLMDGLRETVLLAFEAGHAKIGIWDGPASYMFRDRGKQFLKECLAYAMRDTLGGRSGTYEVVLLGADGA